jgi:threonine/homoserine/homoserine lactone efflux protein
MREILSRAAVERRKEATNVRASAGSLPIVPVQAFVSFALVDLLLVMTPGADWAFAISVGVNGDRVAPAISGLATGYLAQVALVAAGLGAVLIRTTSALGIIALAGAAYLLALGIGVLRRPARIATAGTPALSPLRTGLRGAAISGLNPKGLLLLFAILPQFVVLGASWPVAVQLAALGLFHVLACALVYTAVAVGANRLLRSCPRAARIVGNVSGAAMILVALALVAEQLVRR